MWGPRKPPKPIVAIRMMDMFLATGALIIGGLLLLIGTEPLLREASSMGVVPVLYGAVGIALGVGINKGWRAARAGQFVFSCCTIFGAAFLLATSLRNVIAGDGHWVAAVIPGTVLAAGVTSLVYLFHPASRAFFRGASPTRLDAFD